MEMRRTIEETFVAVADLIWPRRCIVCDTLLQGKHSGLEQWICHECMADMPLTRFWRWPENPAEQRMWKKVGVVSATSLFFYREAGGYMNLVRDVKYYGNTRLGRCLGKTFGNYLKESGRFSQEPVQAVTAIPLHPFRQWRRGYNQAEVEALGIAMELGVPLIKGLLRRGKYTHTQTTLSVEERRKNVRNAFSVNTRIARKLAGKGVTHILVVDDVMTSGATLAAAVTQLMELFSVSVASLGFVE